jgi:predicted ATP-grasp superfamily ATP-dependent carboligase
VTATATVAPAVEVTRRPVTAAPARTLLALAGLGATLPLDAALVGLALLFVRPTTPAAHPRPRTVLISGAKMTKALALARSFHAAGHRVILVESAKYRFTGHRLSRAVDRFHVVPEPHEPGYAEALLEVVRREHVDVYVPVSSPAASVHDADARALIDGVCEVIHVDSRMVRNLDDKVRFSRAAATLGLRVPDSHQITDARQIQDFPFPPGRSYILKRVAYNPVGRMDLTRLSADTPERNVAFARSLHISEDDPWILQEFIAGQEYCTHSTVRQGRVQVYGCCESSAFLINYAQVDKPEIHNWVQRFAAGTGITGQVSFDFIEGPDGHPYAIECNPRTHSAITMFYDHSGVAAAYLEDGHPMIVPNPSARPTYWIYHELWRLLTQPRRLARLRTIVSGTDAVFSWQDPLPYFGLHHLQIPALLLGNLRARKGWSRIDFNIGKLVEPGGD